MILETERLILRPWREDDAESLYEYAKDPRVGPAAGWPVHTGVENSRQIIKDVLSAPETYAIVQKGGDKAIGSIGLKFSDNSDLVISDTEAEIGYWIGVPYWGKGMMPEAVRKLMEHAFNELSITKIWCGYYDGNEKSKRVQEKCGLKYHHTEKDKEVPLLSDVRTEHFTCITKEQWLNG